MKKLIEKLKKYLRPFLNLRFLLCFSISWMITNGWAYIFIIIGTKFEISWMAYVGTSYIAILWLPITPEKLITIPLAMVFQKVFFKKDEKTKKILNEMSLELKKDINHIKNKLKIGKNNKDSKKDDE
ncbi:MAG: hypothetical protein ACI311_07195 [Bacilli bacterium]